MEQIEFEPLKIGKISEAIEKRLKQDILSKKLKPGSRLPTEKKMAEQFEVSLVTLREGLRALEILGLIEKKKGHGGGIFISKINNDSIKASLEHFLSFKDLSPKHLYEVRKIIEPLTVKLTAERITLDEIKELEENVSYCEQKLTNVETLIKQKEFFDLDSRNNDFHRMIAEDSHNPILGLTVDFVLGFIKGCETNILVPDINYCIDNIMDHRRILEYLKQRDGEKCEKEMILHLKRLDEYLLTLTEGLNKSLNTFGKEESR